MTISDYNSIHDWLRGKYGSADHCESNLCKNTSVSFHWAKLHSKEYEKKRGNFIQLCARCHSLYDRDDPKKTKADGRKTLMVRFVDPWLHVDFKVACIDNGETMNKAMQDLIKYYIISTKNLTDDKGSNSSNN